MLRGLDCTRIRLVALTVILAFVLTVIFMLVRVRVGVLPILLLITVIICFRCRRLVIRVVPLLGSMLVTIALTFSRVVTCLVAVRPLLASTIIRMFRLRNVVIVWVEALWGVLVNLTIVMTWLLIVLNMVARFRVVICLWTGFVVDRLILRDLTSCWPLIVMLSLLMMVAVLRLGMP